MVIHNFTQSHKSHPIVIWQALSSHKITITTYTEYRIGISTYNHNNLLPFYEFKRLVPATQNVNSRVKLMQIKHKPIFTSCWVFRNFRS